MCVSSKCFEGREKQNRGNREHLGGSGDTALYRVVRKELLIKWYLNRDIKEMRVETGGHLGEVHPKKSEEQVQRFRSAKYA